MRYEFGNKRRKKWLQIELKKELFNQQMGWLTD